jgi:hypothetical protein
MKRQFSRTVLRGPGGSNTSLATRLPHDLPPWSTVWSYFRVWRNDGTWERIHTALREQVRLSLGRSQRPVQLSLTVNQ